MKDGYPDNIKTLIAFILKEIKEYKINKWT
jgi:hypothetical protein